MAAVAHASPAQLRAMARPVHIGSYVPSPPARTPAIVYRRRRVAAMLAAAGTLAVLVLAIGSLMASVGGDPAIPSDRPASPAAVYVVRPGDTFWDIARRLEPDGDPRPLVARLVAAHGTPVLVAGERLALPVPA